MTDKLPPNLLALFAPRPALRYFEPVDHAPEARKTSKITGVAQYLDQINNDDEYTPTESWLQRRDRLKMEKKEKQERLLTQGASEDYNPADDPQVRGDAFKTLFVARLSYETTQKDLEREFGRFGPIERTRIVTGSLEGENPTPKNKKKSHRGYAFIVYEREKDMKAAYKETDGIRIKDRRVLVDVERGRTVKGWRPRRFGGGLGGRGYTKAAPPRPAGSGSFNAPAGPGGFQSNGFAPRGDFGGRGGRGGFRGGFRGDRGGFGGDRGGFGGRGGIGYQGGSSMGGRGGYGGQSNGFAAGQPPPNAPSGPGGSRGGGFGSSGGYGGGLGGGGYNGTGRDGAGAGTNGGGYGDPRGPRSSDDSRSFSRGRGGFSDRGGDGRSAAGSGSNMEPVRPRESGGSRDRDRSDRDGGYSSRHRDDDYSSSRKRYHDSDGYDDSRSKRRY
ncbi:MAG: hypothetical protein M1827_001457 [Pycnora praestabilis]|nr:MAG: hypothetical protein M1827_001457 [Pycnora praestabilis]